MLYAPTQEGSVAGWKVSLKTTVKTNGWTSYGAENVLDTPHPCGTDINEESAGTDNSEFACSTLRAANEIELTTTSYVELAEVVVAGHPWDSYPCPPGYASSTGAFSSGAFSSSSDTCKKCPPGTYQDLEGQAFCRPARYSKLNLLDDNFSTYLNLESVVQEIALPEVTANYEIHDVVIYNINFDDYASDTTMTAPHDADGSCAASSDTYAASDCVLKIKDTTMTIGSTVVTISSADNQGTSRRSQTYPLKLTSPTVVGSGKKLEFSGNFLVAEIYVYGVESSEKYPLYTDDEGLTVQQNCPDDSVYKFANDAGSGCERCPAGSALVIDNSVPTMSCVDCLAGQYRAARYEGDCVACEVGHITADPGLGECEICPMGTKEVSRTSCDACAAGWVTKAEGLTVCEECKGGDMVVANPDQSECVECGEGTVPTSDKSGCDDCDAGTFRSTLETSCTGCPDSKYADQPGQSACTDCEMGQEHSPDPRTSCVDCEEGHFRNSAVSVCTKCPITHIATAKKTGDCAKCSPGTESDAANTACVPCRIGLFRGEGHESCGDCSEGYHTDGQTGQLECVKCPQGQETQVISGSTGLECVDCNVGFIAAVPGTPSCVECVSPLVALTKGLAVCSMCALGSERTDSSTCTECNPGHFNNDNSVDVTCKQCPVNTYTDAGAQTECVPCAKHTHSPLGSSLCTPCPPDDASHSTAIQTLQEDSSVDELRWQKCVADLGAACMKETVTSTYGTYNLAFMREGKVQEFPCQYDQDKTPRPKVVFKCSPVSPTEGVLEAVYSCINTESTAGIAALAEDVSSGDVTSTANKLKELTGSATMGIGDVEAVAGVIDELLPENSSEELSEEVTSTLVDTIGNLAAGDLQTNDLEKRVEISKKMMDNMKKIVQSTTVTNKMIKSAKVAIMKIEGEAGTGGTGGTTGVSFMLGDTPDLSSITSAISGSGGGGASGGGGVPAIAIETTAGSLSVVLLVDDAFFPSEETSPLPVSEATTKEEVRSNVWAASAKSFKEGGDDTAYINSFVLEIDVGEQPPGFVLNLYWKPIISPGDAATNILQVGDRKLQMQQKCGVYNHTTGAWDYDRCTTIHDSSKPDSGVVCQCKHNSSFAVLMAATEIDPGYLETQSLLSQILLSGSILGLVLTVGLILPASSLSATRSAKVNLCFSLTLLLASLLFVLQDVLVKGDNSGPIKLKSMGCVVYTMLQHYIWLVVFMWTMIEGFLMYLSLVQVFGSHISNYMLKFNLVAWGVPMILPLAGYFGFTRYVTVGGMMIVDHQYMAETMCFIKPNTTSFYALFFGPLVLSICVNLVFFGLVLKVIKNSKNANLSDREQLLRQMKAAAGVMVLLGTGWVVGVFMNIPEPSLQISLQYAFILINASQGMFVFIFYILLNDAVKNFWLEKLGLKQPATNSASRSAAPRGTAATNVYANSGAKEEDHTYSNAAEFPAKKDDNANL